MPTLLNIKTHTPTQQFLDNGNWKATDYYLLCCKSELWGCATLVTLQKEITEDANEALVYILERSAIEGESWDETIQKDINADEFVQFVLGCGYLSDPEGWYLDSDEFWKNYEEIKNGMAKEKSFGVTKNGVKTEPASLIEKDEIISVKCFADRWNQRQYMVETITQWALFSWGTGA